MHSTRKLKPLESFHYYMMRVLPFVAVRRAVSAVLGRYIRHAASENRIDPRPQLSQGHRQLLDSLRRHGWIRLPPLLSASKVDEIVAFLKDKDLITVGGDRFTLDKPGNDATLASVSTLTTLSSPYILQLMNDPEVLAIAAAYLGCEPTISCVRIDWYSPSAGEPAQVQKFHRDYDDWRFIKLFIYLTDVTDDSGPHEYVQGSHLRSGRLRATTFDETELRKQYGQDDLVKVCGPRGTSFMVDTYGIHRGNVPVVGTRITLQIEYSLLPVRVFDYDCVDLALPAKANRYHNRLFVA